MTAAARQDSFLEQAVQLGVGELHFKIDQRVGLYAVVAIHNTTLGPALGGCRCVNYPNSSEAIKDAMRLARGMSYKSAICKLPYGGGKSVLMRPRLMEDRVAYFEVFGEFLEQLGGRYIAAVDSGTSVEDMDAIAHRTQHVTCTSDQAGDPSPLTALGVFRGIEAAARFSLQRSDLEDLHVAIQGVGHVGHALAALLHEAGARLTVADHNPTLVKRCVDEFDALAVPAQSILDVEADVLAPCALGGIINDNSIHRLRCAIVAGSANNQLSTPVHGMQLQQLGILYAPDYVINAGGLIRVAIPDEQQAHERVMAIYDTLYEIFEQAAKDEQPPELVADSMAETILYSNQPGGHSHDPMSLAG